MEAELAKWHETLSKPRENLLWKKELAMLGRFVAFLVEHVKSDSQWANDKQMFSEFSRFIELLRRSEWTDNRYEALEVVEEAGTFSQMADFWILNATVNRTIIGEIGTLKQGLMSAEILKRGKRIVTSEDERKKIEASLALVERGTADWNNQRFFREMIFYCPGSFFQSNPNIKEKSAYRRNEVYPNGASSRHKEHSFEEIRARKYLSEKLTTKMKLDNTQKAETMIIEPTSGMSIDEEKSEPLSVEDLPEINDDLDTIPVQLNHETLTTDGPTKPIAPLVNQKVSVFSDEPEGQEMTGKQCLTGKFDHFEHSFDQLSIDNDKENLDNHTLHFSTKYSPKKRSNQVLTPQAQRSQKKIHRKSEVPKATPTYVVHNANEMIDNFFEETLHKNQPEPTATLFLDTPTLGQRGKANMTARLLASEPLTPENAKPKFNIFHESILGSNVGSLSTTPSDTLGTSYIDADFDQPVGGTQESTRAITKGRIPIATPDFSVVVKPEEDNEEEEEVGYNPWSEMFVKMQVGQLGIAQPTLVNKSFSDKRSLFEINGTMYCNEAKLGEGGFAKVFLCTPVNQTKKVAIKVQKHGEIWESAILHEANKRLASTRASTALSDFLGWSFFRSGQGVILTSYYKYGTLLDLISANRSDLATRAIKMKPAILFFSAQLTSLMLELHKADILHGDYKPDNVMITEIQNFDEVYDNQGQCQGIKLIDFGRAIYNGAIARNVPFQGTIKTSGFVCPQMHCGDNWRYQVDLYALGMSLHLIMFGNYATIHKKDLQKGRVPTAFSFPRHFDRTEWRGFYDGLLNHQGISDGNAHLESIRDYCVKEYSNLSPNDKSFFKNQYTSYLAQM